MKGNILKLYIIQAIRWAMFFIPTFVLFFLDNGLNMKEVLLLQSIFSFAIIIFEVPSGYISDKLGRKNTIVAGSIISFLGAISYFYGTGFYGFLLAEVLFGIGASFVSGADSALLYDSLKSIQQENTYKAKAGIVDSIGNFSESIASIIGGFIAIYTIRGTFLAYAALLFIAIFVALSLKEPAQDSNPESKQNTILDLLKIVKYSLHDHKEIAGLILYIGLLNASTLTMVFFIQPYFQLVNLPLEFFGIAWAVLNFSVGIFALNAWRYEQYLGRTKSLISLIFISVLGYLTMGIFNQLWALGFIFLFYFSRGISGPIINDYVNIKIESSIRATVLSVKSMIGRIIFAVISPFIGYISDIYSLQTAFLFSAGFFFIGGVLSLLYLKKHQAL